VESFREHGEGFRDFPKQLWDCAKGFREQSEALRKTVRNAGTPAESLDGFSPASREINTDGREATGASNGPKKRTDGTPGTSAGAGYGNYVLLKDASRVRQQPRRIADA
jgi:hypothetical protein